MTQGESLKRKDQVVFLGVSLGWLLLSVALCFFLGPEPRNDQFLWMLVFWGLSNLDLSVLAKFMSVAVRWAGATPEKRPVLAIQAFCWGIFKVVCLGLFIFVLLKGYEIPTYGLLLGVGTLGIVPLVGGILWSQRVLRNA